MRGGVIAAGEGSRLRDAGIATPKPLVEVGGQTLLHRTLEALVASGVESLGLIVSSPEVASYATELRLGVPLRCVVKTTPSSMHSLYELRALLEGDRFVLCTVDSIIRREEFLGFVRHFAARPELDLLLSYTDFVDDEKPLRIAVEADGAVSGLGDEAEASPFVTSGLYGMSDAVFPLLEQALAARMEKLRNLLHFMLHKGSRCAGYRLSKAVDVDRVGDIRVAEAFLAEEGAGTRRSR